MWKNYLLINFPSYKIEIKPAKKSRLFLFRDCKTKYHIKTCAEMQELSCVDNIGNIIALFSETPDQS